MARFALATWGDKTRFRLVNKKSLLAFFDFIDTETGLEYLDWQLVEGKNGRFVASPGKEPYEGKNGKVFPKFVSPAFDATTSSKRNALGEAWLAELTDLASTEYDRVSGNPGPAAKAKKSGAGPLKFAVPPEIDSTDEDDDELPF